MAKKVENRFGTKNIGTVTRTPVNRNKLQRVAERLPSKLKRMTRALSQPPRTSSTTMTTAAKQTLSLAPLSIGQSQHILFPLFLVFYHAILQV